MPVNITKNKIAEVRRMLAAGKISPEKASERIADLEAQGPKWMARYKDISRKDVYEPAPSRTAALRIEQEKRAQIRGRTYTAPDVLRATVKKIVEIYLSEKIAGSNGEASARTVCKHIVRMLGHVQLERLDRDPSCLIAHFRNDLPAEWAPKYRWNYRACLRAAIAYYMETRRVKIVLNPVDVVKMKPGTNRRTAYPTPEQVDALIERARRNPMRWEPNPKNPAWPPIKCGYPTYFPALLRLRFDLGLRGMEAVPLRWEKAYLEPPKTLNDTLPYVTVGILKQGDEKPEEMEIPLTYQAWKELLKLPGQKERGKIFPTRIWPTKQMRRLFDAAGLTDLEPHDMRRTWSRVHKDLDAKKRAMLRGHSEEMDDYYMVTDRKDREEIYRRTWEQNNVGYLRGTSEVQNGEF